MRKCFLLILKAKISVFSLNSLEKEYMLGGCLAKHLIFVYLLPRLYRTQLWRWYDWFPLRNRKWLPFSSTWVHPCFFCTVLVAHQFNSPARLLLASLDERRPSSVYLSHFNFLLRNRLAKWNESWKEASMEGPLFRLFISSRSLFLKKIFPSEASCMEDPL